jgi:hypothetical protein
MNEEKVIQKEVPVYDFTSHGVSKDRDISKTAKTFHEQLLTKKLVELLSEKEWAFAGLQDALRQTGATFPQVHEAIKKAEELQIIEKGADGLYRLANGKSTTSDPPQLRLRK